MMPRIFRSGVFTCLAVVVLVVACSGGSEPALPAETVAVVTTTQPANSLGPAPMATRDLHLNRDRLIKQGVLRRRLLIGELLASARPVPGNGKHS